MMFYKKPIRIMIESVEIRSLKDGKRYSYTRTYHPTKGGRYENFYRTSLDVDFCPYCGVFEDHGTKKCEVQEVTHQQMIRRTGISLSNGDRNYFSIFPSNDMFGVEPEVVFRYIDTVRNQIKAVAAEESFAQRDLT